MNCPPPREDAPPHGSQANEVVEMRDFLDLTIKTFRAFFWSPLLRVGLPKALAKRWSLPFTPCAAQPGPLNYALAPGRPASPFEADFARKLWSFCWRGAEEFVRLQQFDLLAIEARPPIPTLMKQARANL